MRVTTAVLAVLLVSAASLVLAVAAAANPYCDPSYDCGFHYTAPDGSKSHDFDFSSLCTGDDYALLDRSHHTYYAKICGTASQNCLPAGWNVENEYGVAVQTWGAVPSCSPANCTSLSGKRACCTADCQVLGVGAPTWSLVDPANPSTGGVRAKYDGTRPTADDPFWCTFDPATGSQHRRQVSYVFQCDPQAEKVVVVGAFQNTTVDCHYELVFRTAQACATSAGMQSRSWVGTAGDWLSGLRAGGK